MAGTWRKEPRWLSVSLQMGSALRPARLADTQRWARAYVRCVRQPACPRPTRGLRSPVAQLTSIPPRSRSDGLCRAKTGTGVRLLAMVNRRRSAE